jgi:hypothetical protein
LLQRAEIGQIGVDAAARYLYLTGDCLSTLGIGDRAPARASPARQRTCDRPAPPTPPWCDPDTQPSWEQLTAECGGHTVAMWARYFPAGYVGAR